MRAHPPTPPAERGSALRRYLRAPPRAPILGPCRSLPARTFPIQMLHARLRILESDDPDTAFTVLVDALRARLPLRAAAWRSHDREGGWPAPGEAAALLDDAAEDEARLDMGLPGGRLRLQAAAAPGARGARAARELAAAFARMLSGWQRVRRAEEARDTLQRRVEESEALHVLGLAANRTLDPDEVLSLVARATRTLLGAHYVTVTTTTPARCAPRRRWGCARPSRSTRRTRWRCG